MGRNKGKQLSTYVSESAFAELKQKCNEQNINVSQLLKSCVYSYLYDEYTPKKEYWQESDIKL